MAGLLYDVGGQCPWVRGCLKNKKGQMQHFEDKVWPRLLAGEGGGVLLCGLYGDVRLDRVWFLSSLSYTGYIISHESILNRVYNFTESLS